MTNTERSPQTLPQTQKPSRRMKAVKEIDEREERIKKAKERGEKIEGTKADDVGPDAEQSLSGLFLFSAEAILASSNSKFGPGIPLWKPILGDHPLNQPSPLL